MITFHDHGQLKRALVEGETGWYVVLDACDEPAVLEMIDQAKDIRIQSLYRGRAAAEYSAIAPYLCEVNEWLLEWIIVTLAGRPWGVLLHSAEDFDSVRRHLRKLLLVRNPDGGHWYFRFYDPRVLRLFAETSPPEDLVNVFGPIEEFVVEDKENAWLRILPPRIVDLSPCLTLAE